MRSLWQLIFRYHVFILFLVLQGVAITLLVRSNSFHHQTWLSSSNEVTGLLYARRAVVSEYLRLQSVNEELARENALLKSERPAAFLKLSDNMYLHNDTVHLRRYKYTTAKVINNSINRPKNYLTIDRGSRNGIGVGMGVINNGAVVGIVKDVSEHFAVVMPLINTGFRLSVKLSRTNAFGSLEWDGKDPTLIHMNDVPRYANPQKGDTVVTTGYSAYYPEGMLVGTVDGHRIPEGENFYEIDIRLATEYYRLSYVDVIGNLLSEEQRQLENAVANDDD